METSEFEAQLRRDGYLDIDVRSVEGGVFNASHSHAFDVRALVLEGEATIACGGTPRTYRPGDVLEVAAGVEHTEQYGPDGYRYLVGRRHHPQA
jgi:mannose-6-phosphate isomerase-like protein (cupin superfamily)